MKIGLFGFPLTGKTTMFQLLTGVEAPAYAKSGEARVAMARVPDPRLERLTVMYSPKKQTPATIEYLDLAGVEKGQAAKALPLDQLRTADALVHVVRGFHGSVPRSKGCIDPAHDVAAMETEFILADLIVAEKRVERLNLQLRKTNRDEDKQELDLLKRIIQALDQETPLRRAGTRPHDSRFLPLAGPDVLLHRWRGRVSCLDDSPRHARPRRGRDNPQRYRARLHSRRARGLPRPGQRRKLERLPRQGKAAARGQELRHAGRRRGQLPVCCLKR
jgi:hypothetical protein